MFIPKKLCYPCKAAFKICLTFDFIPQLTIAKFLQFSIQRVIGTKVLLGVGKYLAAAVKVMLVFVLVMLIPHLLDIR